MRWPDRSNTEMRKRPDAFARQVPLVTCHPMNRFRRLEAMIEMRFVKKQVNLKISNFLRFPVSSHATVNAHS